MTARDTGLWGQIAGFAARSETNLNWLAAAVLGAVTSTFSTFISTLLGGRLGRDPATDWMVVATIPLRDMVLMEEPSWGVIAAGILFHQWADFSWAVVFFGLLGRFTARLSPWAIVLIGPFWALFTSAVEWFVILSWWQPIFVLSQTYWIGLAVHMSSASLDPLFPWMRDRIAGRPSPHRRFAAGWSALAALGLVVVGTLAALGAMKREWPPHLGGNRAFDQSYMRRMSAHHAQGVELARMAATKAQDPHLRRLACLMAATQKGEIAIFDQWWQSWLGGPLPPATPEDHAAMPGMLRPDEVEALRHSHGAAFDALFRDRMSFHHTGAIVMAEEAMRHAGDPRLRIMAHAIRHEQRGEIELMRGIPPGWAVTRAASSALFEPAGEGSAEERAPAHRH